jgi:hypothetical protein
MKKNLNIKYKIKSTMKDLYLDEPVFRVQKIDIEKLD